MRKQTKITKGHLILLYYLSYLKYYPLIFPCTFLVGDKCPKKEYILMLNTPLTPLKLPILPS